MVGDGGGTLVGGDPPACGDEVGRFHHVGIGHAGEGLDIALIEALDVLGVLLKAVNILGDEVFVDLAPADEYVGDGKGQGAVGAGAGLKEEIGQLF